MKRYTQRWLATSMLVGALALAACGQSATQPTQIAATAQPAPTSAPTATMPPPTAAPTNAPTVTAMPQPTLAPSETPTPSSQLPNDVPWVHSSGTIFADDESFVFAQHGLPESGYNVATAPDSTMIAYISQQGHLIVANLRSGQAMIDESQAIMPTNFVFASDSSALAYGTSQGELILLDLPSGTRHSIPLEQEPVSQDRPTSTLMPIAWTNDGLYSQRVIWGSDAPPQGIVRIDPSSGALTEITNKEHYGVQIAPDGTSIALITGSMPIGDQPTTGIAILDLVSGQMTQPVAEQPQIIRGMRWSPDGTRLLYAVGSSYDASDTRLRVFTASGAASSADTGLVIQFYRDLGWIDNLTPIVLTITSEELRLYRLELNDENPTNPVPILGIPAQPGVPFDGQIIYTPQ